jgi:hypothetical protein
MKTHVMVSEANHLTESALFSIAQHGIAARCLPEHALSVAAGGRMTMKVRCGALLRCPAVRCLPPVSMTMNWHCGTAYHRTHRIRHTLPMKTHVMVSEANHLTDGPVPLRCWAARCLPEHALSVAAGGRMTSIFVVVCRGMQRHRQSGLDHEDHESVRNARKPGLHRRRACTSFAPFMPFVVRILLPPLPHPKGCGRASARPYAGDGRR